MIGGMALMKSRGSTAPTPPKFVNPVASGMLADPTQIQAAANTGYIDVGPGIGDSNDGEDV